MSCQELALGPTNTTNAEGELDEHSCFANLANLLRIWFAYRPTLLTFGAAHLLEGACAPTEMDKRPAAQGVGKGNTATRHPLGGTVLRRREEHPHSLRGCRDPETQALPPPMVPLVFQGCACRYRNPPAVHRCALGMAGAPCFKCADARCTWHSKGAPGISRCTCNFHGRTGRYRGAPAVHRCTL
jgi:hypothetical protein